MGRLRDEIDGLPDDADIDALAKLPYLNATCYELMRLNPPLEIIPTRKLSEPMQLGPYTLEPGTGLMPCPILTQPNPELYPRTRVIFKPERFLGKRPNVFEYFPFGGGGDFARLCICELPNEIGYRTAIREYDLELQGPAPKQPSVIRP